MENLIDQAVEYNDGIGVEMAVLALCMRRDTAVIEVVQNKITSEDFSDARNSIIYGVISEMFYEGTDIDRFTVFAELERRGIADKVGGQSYIYRVGDTTAVQSALASYILALKDRSDRRKILRVIDKIRTQTLGSKARTPLIIDSAINEFSQLKREGELTGLVAIADALKSTLTEVHAEIRDGDTGKIKLGYPKLDAMLGGLGPGTLHILGARPGMGKSALAVNMAINVAAKDKTVVIFSLEMSKEEICKRMMSSAMTKPVNDIIYSHQLTDSDKQQMDQALIKLRDYPIYFDDSADINPATVKSRIQQLCATGNPPKLVFVDYLQLVNMKGLPGRSRNEEVASISRSFKLMAKEFKIPIIALSQLSRDSAKRTDHTPQIADLRDSGAIEQDADTIMFVDRPNYFDDNKDNGSGQGAPPASNLIGNLGVEPAYIYLAKNRHGRTGKDPVWWIASKTMFYESVENDPVEPDSHYAGTVNGETAAQQYDFNEDEDDEQVMDPPLSEDEESQQEDAFMADEHDDYPPDFMSEY